MILAEQKKENNISEYILYMYQTEDLVRAYELNIDRIDKSLLSLLPGSKEEKVELRSWYDNVIHELKTEGKEVHDHLEEIKLIVAELQNLFNQLKASDSDFQSIINKVQPFFDQHKAKNNEIEICLNGMYAYLLLRSDDNPVPDLTILKAELFGEVLSYLSYKFKQRNYLNDN